MNKTALFCDGTEGYVYPPEPKESELVTFRFRTAKDDVDRVGLVTSADTYVMEKECTQGEFDYYTFETRLGKSRSDIVSKCSLGQKNIIMDDVESLARSWSIITLL